MAAAEELLAERAKTAAPTKELTEQEKLDQGFVEAQEWATRPDVAFEKRFKATTGLTPAEFKTAHARVKSLDANTVAETWVEQMGERYLANKNNGARMQAWLEKNAPNAVPTLELLTRCFDELDAANMLEHRVRPEDLSLAQLKAIANNEPLVEDDGLDF